MKNQRVLPYLTICISLMVVLTYAELPLASESDSCVVRIASGLPGGTYYAIANIAADANHAKNCRILSVPSKGSKESISLLRQRKAEFALAQLDAVTQYMNFTQDTTIQIVTVLYYEYLHIIVRNPLTLFSMSEFSGKRIFLGASGSGTEETATMLLEAYGISQSQVQRVDVPKLKAAIRLMRNDSLDIICHVGPLGSEFIRSLLDSADCRLFSIGASSRARYATENSAIDRVGVELKEIPMHTYKGQDGALTTFAVPSVLLSLRDLPRPLVEAVDSAVFQAMDSLTTENKGLDLSVVTSRVRIPNSLPVFSGARINTSARGWSAWFELMLFVAITMLIIFGLRKRLLRMFHLRRSKVYFAIFVAFGYISVFSAFGAYLFERKVNNNFETLPETLWSLVLYLTSGLENRVPFTTGGRIFGGVLLVSGPVIVALLTGLLASNMVIRALERKMSGNQSDHYVLLNWNVRAREIVKQIHSANDKSAVVLVVSDDSALNMDRLQNEFASIDSDNGVFENVYFCPGSPTEVGSLKSACVDRAKSVVIMAANADPAKADECTLQCLSSLREFALSKRCRVNVVLELLNIANKSVVDVVCSDFPGRVDYIAAGEIRTLLMAQSALVPGLSRFYKDLLRFTEDTNEVYRIPLPRSCVGKTFAEVASQLIVESADAPIIPVAVVRNTCNGAFVVTNPRAKRTDGTDNPYYVLEKGDKLLVISWDEPKLVRSV